MKVEDYKIRDDVNQWRGLTWNASINSGYPAYKNKKQKQKQKTNRQRKKVSAQRRAIKAMRCRERAECETEKLEYLI